MRVTSKGQVTIPADVRRRLGIKPGTQVEFQLDELGARLVRAKTSHGESIVRQMVGRGDVPMTTAEIMALTRGDE
ncbi:MAG: AbrB/MazE/SpoVT family DNA-binding domain-containing protein [Solirubrobacteraceae bacterium]